MIEVSVCIAFIDNFIFNLGIVIFNRSINLYNYLKKYLLTDFLTVILISIIQLFIDNANLIIWFIASIVWQKLKRKIRLSLFK